VAALAASSLAVVTDAQAARGWSGARPAYSGHWSGGHWRGGWYGPRVGFYVGAPILWSAWYWGYPYYYPYYYDYYYPRPPVVVERYPDYEPGPTTEAPPGPGAPAQGPTYMNYCESSKAYYPKVTTCPEGWKFLPSR
jgi:hypothetical protein